MTCAAHLAASRFSISIVRDGPTAARRRRSGVPSARRRSRRRSWTTWSARRRSIHWPFPAGGAALPIATTRPELLPACVAVFVHPDDARYQALIGSAVERRCWARWCRCWPIRWRGPGEGDGRGDVLHLRRRDRRGVVAHARAAAARDRRARWAAERGRRATYAGLTTSEARRAIVAAICEAARAAAGRSRRLRSRCVCMSAVIRRWSIS